MRPYIRLAAATALVLSASCSDKQPTTPTLTGERITLSLAQVEAMAEQGEEMVESNSSLRSFVDSTLLALQAGVDMQRLDVSTNLTGAPLYFIGIHRLISRATGGSFSTWTVIGFEHPADFRSIVQLSGFAQTEGATAPMSVDGMIGDGSGVVNGQLMQVASSGLVTVWNFSTGSASFRSSAPNVACPNGNPELKTVCTLETMHVKFTVNAAQSASTSVTRQAAVITEVAVPAIRLTYAP